MNDKDRGTAQEDLREAAHVPRWIHRHATPRQAGYQGTHQARQLVYTAPTGRCCCIYLRLHIDAAACIGSAWRTAVTRTAPAHAF